MNSEQPEHNRIQVNQRHVDRLFITIAFLALLLLLALFFLLDTPSLVNIGSIRRLLQDIIGNLIPSCIIFIASFFLVRHVLNALQEQRNADLIKALSAHMSAEANNLIASISPIRTNIESTARDIDKLRSIIMNTQPSTPAPPAPPLPPRFSPSQPAPSRSIISNEPSPLYKLDKIEFVNLPNLLDTPSHMPKAPPGVSRYSPDNLQRNTVPESVTPEVLDELLVALYAHLKHTRNWRDNTDDLLKILIASIATIPSAHPAQPHVTKILSKYIADQHLIEVAGDRYEMTESTRRRIAFGGRFYHG